MRHAAERLVLEKRCEETQAQALELMRAELTRAANREMEQRQDAKDREQSISAGSVYNSAVIAATGGATQMALGAILTAGAIHESSQGIRKFFLAAYSCIFV